MSKILDRIRRLTGMTKVEEWDENPFIDVGDLPRSERTYPPCPKCGSTNTHISYYGCDSDPYPFEGYGVDCWECGAVFDSIKSERNDKD